jgi:RNA-directed DNA polymerase
LNKESSTLLSNIYLDPLDHLMAERGFEMVRYADDFVVMRRTLEEATAALALMKEWTASAGLTLHPTKTRLVDERKDGFDFLGYHFDASKRWPPSKKASRNSEIRSGRRPSDPLDVACPRPSVT